MKPLATNGPKRFILIVALTLCAGARAEDPAPARTKYQQLVDGRLREGLEWLAEHPLKVVPTNQHNAATVTISYPGYQELVLDIKPESGTGGK